MGPLYVHDCPSCMFLGQFTDDRSEVHDLYSCRDIMGATVIARWGNDGSEYSSGIVFQDHPSLREATRRAVRKGGPLRKWWVVTGEGGMSWSILPSRSIAILALRKKAKSERGPFKIVRAHRFFNQ